MRPNPAKIRSSHAILSGITLLLLLASCQLAPAAPSPEPSASPTISATPSVTPTFTLTPTPTVTLTPTLTYTPTETFTPTETPTLTPTPTPVVLRIRILERANCRYGPGAPFLYKYGLVAESNMEAIGRDPAGTWLLIRAIGGTNPCWVNATLVEVRGDRMALPEVDPDIIQAWSPYYGALTNVWAIRTAENEVTVSWNQLVLRAGDDSLQTPYVIEAWTCQGGQIVFTVVGSWTLSAVVPDEPGCSEPSHGRVYGAEKHGYTPWMEIPWPQADP